MKRTTAPTPELNTLAVTLLLAVSSLALLAGAPAAAASDEAERTAARPSAREVAEARATAGSYTLGPEDLVEVFVWKEPELSTTATVRPDGRIALPLAGELPAAGKTPKELEEEITARLEEYIDVPLVTVIVKEVNSPKVSVLGEVRRPGRFVINQKTTLLDAIAMSGGFTEFAHRGDVLVLRTTPSGVERISLDVKRLLRNGGRPFYLQPGDTVHVD